MIIQKGHCIFSKKSLSSSLFLKKRLSMEIPHSAIQKNLARFETRLNSIEYLPLPEIRLGRILLGTAQVVAGVAHAALRFVHSVFDGKMATLMRWKEGRYLFIHGGANLARGVIGLFPMAYGIMGILGSTFALIAFDAFVGRFNYWGEAMNKGVYPLNSPEVWKRIDEIPTRLEEWLEVPEEEPIPEIPQG